MNLMTKNLEKTMSSLDIAKLCDKDISHVNRDIRTMVVALKDDPELDHVLEDKDSRGYTLCFHLNKTLSLTVAAGYSIKLRKAIIDRWQELEAQQATFEVPKTLSSALRLAADLQDTVEQQAEQLALQAPAVSYVEDFVKCEGGIGVREAAKSFGFGERKFIEMLLNSCVMFRENGSLQAYAKDIEAGKFLIKQVKDGFGRARVQTWFTPKGLHWTAKKLNLSQLLAGV